MANVGARRVPAEKAWRWVATAEDECEPRPMEGGILTVQIVGGTAQLLGSLDGVDWDPLPLPTAMPTLGGTVSPPLKGLVTVLTRVAYLKPKVVGAGTVTILYREDI